MANVNQILSGIENSIKSKQELEYFYIHRDRYQFVLNKILSLNMSPSSRILDIGCYPPHLFHCLENLGFEVWGIASKHEPVKLKNVVSSNLETDSLPLKENYFDLILFSEVIEHLIVSPKIYLPKLKKLLKNDGQILITTPNAAHLKNRMKLLLGKSPSFGINQLYESKWGDDSIYFRHNREFTGSELQQIMKDSGFKIDDFGYFAAYSPFRKNLNRSPVAGIVKLVGYLITILFPGLKDSQYILVGK